MIAGLRSVLALAALSLAGFMMATPTIAEMAPSDENGRYIVQRAQDGWFRVDTRTGEASLCSERSSSFTCEMLPDDRAALLDEIDRLNDRVAVLENQLELAGEVPAGTGDDVAQAPRGDGEQDLPSFMPSEEQMDEIMRSFEGMVRRFLAMVQSLREDYAQGL